MEKEKNKKHINKSIHAAVLLQEVIENINLQKGDVVFDGTFGGGHYSKRLCEKIGEEGTLIATDLDTDALERGKINLYKCKCNINLINSNFSKVDSILNDLGVDKIDSAVLDLGFSSDQLNFSERGFSFKNEDEDIVLTLNNNPTEDQTTAFDILNHWHEDNIADVIYGFGGEQFSRRIAKGIIEFRKNQEIKKVKDLVEIINNSVPNFYKNRRTHPATKTFQSLRIAVNSELEVIKETLPKIIGNLKPKGRLAVVTFHSLEDKVVKNIFRDLKKEGIVRFVNKKPISASKEELLDNPRSRSAKLRVVEKLF